MPQKNHYPTHSTIIATLLFLIAILCNCRYATASTPLNMGVSQEAKNLVSPHSAVGAIIAAAFTEQQLQLNILYIPRMRSLDQANQGYTDGDLLRTPETGGGFSNLIQVPEAVCYVTYYIYATAGSSTSDNWQNIAKPSFIHLANMPDIDSMWPHTLTPISQQRSANITTALDDINAGKGNLILLPEGLPEAVAKQRGEPPLVKLQPAIRHQGAYIWLHKRHTELVAPLALSVHNQKTSYLQNHRMKEQDLKCSSRKQP